MLVSEFPPCARLRHSGYLGSIALDEVAVGRLRRLETPWARGGGFWRFWALRRFLEALDREGSDR